MPPTIIDLGSANATFTGGDGDYLITGANGTTQSPSALVKTRSRSGTATTL
jgi:hypothetical protein